MSPNTSNKCCKCGAKSSASIKLHRFPKPGTSTILQAAAWATFCWPNEDWSSLESLSAVFKKHKFLCSNISMMLTTSLTPVGQHALKDTQFQEYQGNIVCIALLYSLRSKISGHSIIQQLDVPVAGCTKDPISLASRAALPALSPADQTMSMSKRFQLHVPVAGCSKDPIKLADRAAPLPALSAADQTMSMSKPFQLDVPVAGCSKDPISLESRAAPLPALSPADQAMSMSKPFQLDVPVAGCSKDPISLADRAAPLPALSAADQTMSTDLIKTTKTNTKKTKLKGIIKQLDKTKQRELSETEQKLYKICRNKIKSIQRLKKKISKKCNVNKIEKVCDDESVKKLFNLKLNHSFTLLLESQLINCQRPKHGRRYNLDQKLLALTLYKKSPSCYRLLTNIFALPCPATLNKMLNRVPMKAGINQQVFAGLRAMAESFTDEENLCSLVFDEMAIKKHLNYNVQTDRVDGFVDHGINHGRTERVACNTLVFMLCGLRKTWKQPVAFYFSDKSGTSDELHVLIKEVLTECFQVGLNVVATICYMNAVNIKALHTLGATAETPYFRLDDREIVTIADPPHLLKCLRNMFMAHDIQIPVDTNPDGNNVTKGTAKWDHIKQFYVSDNMNPSFVYAPALTEKHINPNSNQKMRVKLAAQVFSHSVTAGILAKIATNELPAEAHVTATLLTKFDQLFDALNAYSKDLKRGKKFSTNLTARSPHLDYFTKMKKFIEDMKFLNAKRIPPSQSGWIQTLTAVERLWNNFKKLGIPSLSTRRLNQDPLENFFGCVRYNCGSNYNPTISQFIAGFKTATITNLKICGKNKNCEDDDAVLSNNLKCFLMTEDDENEHVYQYLTDENPIDSMSSASVDELEDWEAINMISSEMQACAYVCGFIIKKINTSCT